MAAPITGTVAPIAGIDEIASTIAGQPIATCTIEGVTSVDGKVCVDANGSPIQSSLSGQAVEVSISGISVAPAGTGESNNIPHWSSTTTYVAEDVVFLAESNQEDADDDTGNRIWVVADGRTPTAGTVPTIGLDWITEGAVGYSDTDIATYIGTAPTDNLPSTPRTGGTTVHVGSRVKNAAGIVWGYSSQGWVSLSGLTISETDSILIDANRAIAVDHSKVIALWNDNISYADGDFVWTTANLTNTQGTTVPGLTIHRSNEDTNDDDPDGSNVDWEVIHLIPQNTLLWDQRLKDNSNALTIIDNNDSGFKTAISAKGDGSNEVLLRDLLKSVEKSGDTITVTHIDGSTNDFIVNASSGSTGIPLINPTNRYETDTYDNVNFDDITSIKYDTSHGDPFLEIVLDPTSTPDSRGTTGILFSTDTTDDSSTEYVLGYYTGFHTSFAGGQPSSYTIYVYFTDPEVNIQINTETGITIDNAATVAAEITAGTTVLNANFDADSVFRHLRTFHNHSAHAGEIVSYAGNGEYALIELEIDNLKNVEAFPETATNQVLTNSSDGNATWEDSSSAGHVIQDDGTDVTTPRGNLNFVQGTGDSLVISDDADNDATIITLAASSSGGISFSGSPSDGSLLVKSGETLVAASQTSLITAIGDGLRYQD